MKLELDKGKTCPLFFFLMFLNDLEEFLLTKDIVGLKSITDELETELEIYLKIFVMLYADDTILLAESAEDLQVQLNAFGEYCDNWKMKVNVNKTKIMVFGFGKLRQNLKFTYKNVDIEIVKQFNYLGVIFTKTCNLMLLKSIFLTKRLRQCTKFLKWEGHINYQ